MMFAACFSSPPAEERQEKARVAVVEMAAEVQAVQRRQERQSCRCMRAATLFTAEKDAHALYEEVMHARQWKGLQEGQQSM